MHSIRTKRLIFFDHVQCHMCPTRLARLRAPGQADITSDSERPAGSIESIELNRPRPATAEEERIKALEREVRTLRKANEILRLASAFFAQAELDRRFKP
jgi:transposase-like protein